MEEYRNPCFSIERWGFLFQSSCQYNQRSRLSERRRMLRTLDGDVAGMSMVIILGIYLLLKQGNRE
jgi:hypothetical protein